MTATADRLARLQEVRLFSEFSQDELEHLDELADEIDVEPGKVFVEQGHYSRDAYIVISGEAAVERDGRRIGTAGPGDAIGELAVIEPGMRTATVTAETPMVVLAMNSPEFLTAVEDIPALARNLMRSLAKRLRDNIEDDGLI